MKNDWEYTRLLLDVSFQEGTRYWTRTNIFLAAQSVIFGFAINIIGKGSVQKPFMLAVCGAGFFLSLLFLQAVRVSSHYFQVWLSAFCNEVQNPSNTLTDAEKGYLSKLSQVLKRNETELPWPGIHSTTISLVAAIFFLLLWILLTCAVYFEWIKLVVATGA